MEYTGRGPVAGGTIMGIHNLAIVFPQFIVSSNAHYHFIPLFRFAACQLIVLCDDFRLQ